jgi:hypothetical protein
MSLRREELVPGRPEVIVFDSLTSRSTGPTIHIDFQSLTRLHQLEAIMRKLASRAAQQIPLAELGDTHWVPPLIDIVLAVGPNCVTPGIRYEKRGEGLACTWTNSVEGWLDSADETAVMITHGGPCHQYFNDRHAILGQADCVTITIAFLE